MEQKCHVPAGIHDAGLSSTSGGPVVFPFKSLNVSFMWQNIAYYVHFQECVTDVEDYVAL